LEDLNYLLSADQLLLPYLKSCTFIPSNSPLGEEKGGASAGLMLHKAEELFDPEELELASLLGQECFPSMLLLQRQGGEPLQPLFSSQILSSLRKLGLQVILFCSLKFFFVLNDLIIVDNFQNSKQLRGVG
jgi:hypothetical protein